ncbi:MAG: 4-aminobutyrate aminotransferase / (S)-3-amino-2-methylpropionate transaminase / 5-aminovalerate [Candidatus Sumerlaeota bacterium]|nr:4-aminobutyrate aminotransferase / (S)-3-amino-2-methylpropionate transaminase / 5-aminovalerate [Candidatus Sumerlaeota bacterium]
MSSSAKQTNAELLKRRLDAIPRGPFNVAPIFVERAEGARLWDVEGKEYIDFCGGIGVMNVGHNHPRVVEAVKKQADKFLHTCFHVVMYEEYVRLAERLNRLVPINGPCKTTFFNSGAEAGENAVKISRAYTKRTGVVAFERGFHGRTLLAMTLTGKVKPYASGFGPFAPDVYHLPYGPFFANPKEYTDAEVERMCHEALDHLFAYQVAPENTACIIAEPVLGEGGFLPMHHVAMKILREKCTELGIVYVSDEVQSGFGRCGAMFAIERYQIEPDMVAMAKSMGGGLVLSGVTARAEIMEAPQVGGIGGTYGGNPIACAAGNAVLDIMVEEKLPERAQKIGEKTRTAFAQLEAKHAFLRNSRGLGAMCAIEVVDSASGKPDAAKAGALVKAALDRGLLLMTASGNVIRTLMPLVITDSELDRALALLAEAADAVA